MNEKNGEAQAKRFSMNMKRAKQKNWKKKKKNRCDCNGYSYVIYDSLLYYFKN